MTFIVIDGTDGAGKATQTKLLQERLVKEGKQVSIADFPRYGNTSCRLVEQYLNGFFGSNPHDCPAKITSALYAFDRFMAANEMKEQLAKGDIIISNRYVSANKGHQLGKIKDEAERIAFLDWVNNLEYVENAIPKEDVNILLYVPPTVSQKYVDMKNKRDYTDKKRDIHEADLNHLQDSADAFLFVAEREGWHVIECSKDGEMLSREDIHERIFTHVKKFL